MFQRSICFAQSHLWQLTKLQKRKLNSSDCFCLQTVAPISKASVQSPGGNLAVAALATSASATTAYECMDIACLCGFFGGTGGSNCVLPNGQRLQKGVRKEYRVMTDAERNRYHTAMWTIKNNGDYDTLSRIHTSFQTSPGAHSGPAFLPWHREYIKRYGINRFRVALALSDRLTFRLEIALRRVDPTVSLPYWDSTLESTIPDSTWSCLFTNELMGRAGSNGNIATGAFRGWLIIDVSLSLSFISVEESDVTAVYNTGDFRQVLANTAPDQSRSARETQYPQDSSSCFSQAHYGSNTMQPFFPMVNTDGLSNEYTGTITACRTTATPRVAPLKHLESVSALFDLDNLYSYAPRPTCSASNRAGCGSRFLFCDLSHGAPRCAAKIAVDGPCGGYTNNEDRCYLSVCSGNQCVPVNNVPTTQPPIIIAPPAGNNQETCFNEQQCCAIWANSGECRRNPSYMNLWCKASCGICTPRTYNLNVECSNRSPQCSGWANRGECSNNPAWMTENCRQSCNRCGTTRQQACSPGSGTTQPPQTTAPPVTSTCLNQHYCCIAWASRGYCSSNVAYMRQYCQPSCNFCRGPSSSSCINFSNNCAYWAQTGQCNNNPQYMWENCKQSCGTCYLLNLSSRLSACGFSRRLLRNGKPVSEFAVNPFQLPLRRQSALQSLVPGSEPQVSLAPAPPPKNRRPAQLQPPPR
ncbi:unnamed protein product [Heligmosomoides polygyrus]|uniref:ShKT domain-containing protein n=1 Tax=Heligmosomoides polygyrus TaxID=6339 RepID=A0A3P8DVH3_HELPZ|nr:unnamed protein product [Heligmosomoides polygyrus]